VNPEIKRKFRAIRGRCNRKAPDRYPDYCRRAVLDVLDLLNDVCGEIAANENILALDDIEADLGAVDASWIEALDKAAVEMAEDTARGEFIRKLAEAWLAADQANKEVLRRAWQRLVFRERLGDFMEAG